MTRLDRSRSVPEIHLRYLDLPTLALLGNAPERFAIEGRVSLGNHRELVQEVANQTRALIERQGERDPWGGYPAIDPTTRAVVGTCAYKGPPELGFSRTGEVIDPEDGPVWRWDWHPGDGSDSRADE